MVHKRSDDVLFATPFPIYAIRTLGDRHFLAAGGGGAAKTGVPNRLEIWLFDVHENSWNSVRTAIHDTNDMATMGLDVVSVDPSNGRYLVACGQEGYCVVYELQFAVASLVNGELSTDGSPSSSSQSSVAKKLSFSVRELQRFQSDFCPLTKASLGPFQKVVRFHPQCQFIVTGGADGHFRIWDWPSCRKRLDGAAHKDDVDDMDVCPQGARLLTVGRDGQGFVWQIKDAAKLADLTQLDQVFIKAKTTPSPTGKPMKFRYRFCRFAPALSTKRSHFFFTCAIPVVRHSKRQSCYLSKWSLNVSDNCTEQLRHAVVPSNGEEISAICVSGNGAYIGFGTLGGSVLVVETRELTLVQLWSETHDIFVTGVDFLPTNPNPSSAFSPFVVNSRCALISSSAANCCQLHVVEIPKERGIFWILFTTVLLVWLLCRFLEFLEF